MSGQQDQGTSNGGSAGAGPHLESLSRVKNLPSVQQAIDRTCSTYSYVKDSHHLINWALNYAEAGLNYATATAAPLAKKLEGPISTVDQKLCQGLDIVERNAPIVKEPPAQVSLFFFLQNFTFYQRISLKLKIIMLTLLRKFIYFFFQPKMTELIY